MGQSTLIAKNAKTKIYAWNVLVEKTFKSQKSKSRAEGVSKLLDQAQKPL